jgi:[acyl-carrier-protein] S-malonyltransferase
MVDEGVDTIIEIGPGKAISKFIAKTVDDVKVYSIDTVEDFEATVKELGA